MNSLALRQSSGDGIYLAKSLEMDVLAQGIETDEQREFLDDCDCNAYQGYLSGRLLPIDQFDALLEQFAAPGSDAAA